MQSISTLNKPANKRQSSLRSVVVAAAATLLLAGWSSAAKADVVLENGDAGQTFSTAQFIPSSAFTTPPTTVFGDFPTATIIGGAPFDSRDNIDLYSFNALEGQKITLDIDNAANGDSIQTSQGPNNLSLALFSGNGALLAYNDDSPVDPGSIAIYDPELAKTASLDPFIGTYRLTYPNSNLNGTPIVSTLDPNRNTYYVAVLSGSLFIGTSPSQTIDSASSPTTVSGLARPDSSNGSFLFGGISLDYTSLGYNVGLNTGGTDPGPSFYNGQRFFPSTNVSPLSPYTLQVSLDPNVSPAPTAPVPEPGTMALMGLGIAGLAASRRRKKNRSDVSAVVA